MNKHTPRNESRKGRSVALFIVFSIYFPTNLSSRSWLAAYLQRVYRKQQFPATILQIKIKAESFDTHSSQTPPTDQPDIGKLPVQISEVIFPPFVVGVHSNFLYQGRNSLGEKGIQIRTKAGKLN